VEFWGVNLHISGLVLYLLKAYHSDFVEIINFHIYFYKQMKFTLMFWTSVKLSRFFPYWQALRLVLTHALAWYWHIGGTLRTMYGWSWNAVIMVISSIIVLPNYAYVSTFVIYEFCYNVFQFVTYFHTIMQCVNIRSVFPSSNAYCMLHTYIVNL